MNHLSYLTIGFHFCVKTRAIEDPRTCKWSVLSCIGTIIDGSTSIRLIVETIVGRVAAIKKKSSQISPNNLLFR